MRAKYIRESYGSGFSMTGGMIRGISRGGGFGGASNLGAPTSMYTYEIKSLNQLLTQKQNKISDEEIIHIGLTIRGKKLNDLSGKYYRGHLIEIKKTDADAIKYYVILNEKTGTKIKINPTTATLSRNTPLMTDLNLKDVYGDEPGEQKSNLKEGQLIPENLEQLFEILKFERGQDPKTAMNVGIMPGDFVDNLVKIMNYTYFQYNNAEITKTSKGIYMDVDGNRIPKKDIAVWMKEILTEDKNEVELSDQQINQLLFDIKNKSISRAGNYPGLDDEITIIDKKKRGF